MVWYSKILISFNSISWRACWLDSFSRSFIVSSSQIKQFFTANRFLEKKNEYWEMKSRMDMTEVDEVRSSCGKGRDVRNMIYISNSFNSFIVERSACPQIWRVLWGGPSIQNGRWINESRERMNENEYSWIIVVIWSFLGQ